MKDSIITLAEAVRLARLELHCYRDPRCAQTAEWTVSRLEELLLDPELGRALMVLVPEAESPSIVPDQVNEPERVE
jgi:hypothetical protein